MKLFDNRKGISIGINMIVVLAVALVVLIVITGWFLGGFGEIGGAIQNVFGGASEQANGTHVGELINNTGWGG
ncbi:MAG: hypothetical protein ABIG20_02115 [archaeon]